MTRRRPCPPSRQWVPVDPSAVYQCHNTAEVGSGKTTTQRLDDPAAQAFHDAAPARERGFLIYEGRPLIEHWSRYMITTCHRCGQRYWEDWDGHNPLDKSAPRRAFREVRGQTTLFGCHVIGDTMLLAGGYGDASGWDEATALTVAVVILVAALIWWLEGDDGRQ